MPVTDRRAVPAGWKFPASDSESGKGLDGSPCCPGRFERAILDPVALVPVAQAEEPALAAAIYTTRSAY